MWWNVVGPGYGWLAGAAVLMFGGTGWAAGGGWLAGAGTVAAGVAISVARRRMPAGVAFAAAAALYAGASFGDGGVPGTISGAALLGGITGEMLLGHWYLVDPTLPRWALKRLAAVGAVGVVADGLVLGLDADWGGTVTAWAFVALAVTTLVLMVAVWFALNEPSYSGVMAATGLSYLAILTAIGAAVSGRALVDEGSTLLAGAGRFLGTLAVL